MTGQNIICFAKDWNENPTSNNHVMLELARGNRVLWLNSIATRAPKLGSARDMKKIFRKLAGFFQGARRIGENFWVYTPIVLPLPHSAFASRLNKKILGITLKLLRRKLGMHEFQLWTFLPNVVDYVGTLDESLVVYYCVDEWSKFNYVNGNKTADAERRLLARADIVFASAQSLVQDRLPSNPRTYLSRHGVNHDLFSAALDDATPVPADLAKLPKPVVGFYGTLQDWVDFELIAHLAERHPEWSIVLIGAPAADLSRLAHFSNVHFLGRKPHDQLPGYCKGFSVGIIPYVINPRILHVNPIKLREYLSAGVPVVSVALPEVQPYQSLCCIAGNYQEFEQGVIEAIRQDSSEARRARSAAMKDETWERRVSEIGDRVMQVRDRHRTATV